MILFINPAIIRTIAPLFKDVFLKTIPPKLFYYTLLRDSKIYDNRIILWEDAKTIQQNQ